MNESPLVHTCNDAKMLASILRKPEMGFKVISLMNLTRDEMYQALGIFYSLLGEGVYGLVYFAGHGFEEGGQNYLVPVDTVGDWVPERAICAQRMLDDMNRYRTELIVFLLDICRKRWVHACYFVMLYKLITQYSCVQVGPYQYTSQAAVRALSLRAWWKRGQK